MTNKSKILNFPKINSRKSLPQKYELVEIQPLSAADLVKSIGKNCDRETFTAAMENYMLRLPQAYNPDF